MILVTGGTGLVGGYLLYELTSKGEKVRALVRQGKPSDFVQKLFSCRDAGAEQLSLIEWVQGDITDYYSLLDALEGVQDVYHCAALISFDPRDRKKMLHTNVEGTANVVNACQEKGIRKLCHVSSIAALGRSEQDGIIDENSRWKTSRRNSGYAVSKYGSEREVWRGIEEGLNAVIINPSVILGASCLPKTTNRLFSNIDKLLPFYNEGVNGYVDVRDVVQSMILLMNSPVSGERFVINSENLSLKQLFTTAADLLGKRPPSVHVGRLFFSIAWRLEWIRCRITGKPPLISRENVRSAQARSCYSSDKFARAFGYSFIPIRTSLKDAFTAMGKIPAAS